jgi:hypothetical protein
MSPEEILHLRERMMVHRQRAKDAADPRVGKVHAELADLYDAALLGGGLPIDPAVRSPI